MYSDSDPSYGRCAVIVVRQEISNVDLLEWFSEEERRLCGYCAERASVTLPAAHASFCLGCGAVTIDGLRVDVDRRFDHL